jgi:glucans biosynthesis protein
MPQPAPSPPSRRTAVPPQAAPPLPTTPAPRGNPNLANTSRCGARTRAGCLCRAPAIRGKLRCPAGQARGQAPHGGRSTSPRTAEGLARLRAARTTHGGDSAESRAFNRHIISLLRRGRLKLDAHRLRHALPPGLAARLAQLPPELQPPPWPSGGLFAAQDRAVLRAEAEALAPWRQAVALARQGGASAAARAPAAGRRPPQPRPRPPRRQYPMHQKRSPPPRQRARPHHRHRPPSPPRRRQEPMHQKWPGQPPPPAPAGRQKPMHQNARLRDRRQPAARHRPQPAAPQNPMHQNAPARRPRRPVFPQHAGQHPCTRTAGRGRPHATPTGSPRGAGHGETPCTRTRVLAAWWRSARGGNAPGRIATRAAGGFQLRLAGLRQRRAQLAMTAPAKPWVAGPSPTMTRGASAAAAAPPVPAPPPPHRPLQQCTPAPTAPAAPGLPPPTAPLRCRREQGRRRDEPPVLRGAG